LAVGAIQDAYGLDTAAIGQYKLVSTFFDVTDPEKPLWKFLFRPESWSDFEGGLDDPQYNLRYRAEINARTEAAEKTEAFQFVAKDRTNLEYDLKWH